MTFFLPAMDTPDTAPVALNADQRAVAAKTLGDLRFGAATLAERLQKYGALPPDLTKSVLSLAQFHIAELATFAGIEIESKTEIEQRHAQLRAANERIRELEHSLGGQVTAEHVSASVQRLAEKLRHWWRCEGFGYISDLSVSEYGHIKVDFSCYLSGDFFLIDSPTPVSDKEAMRLWLQSWRDKGFALTQESSSRDWHLADCDENHRLLARMLESTFPSIKIWSTKNSFGRSGERHLVQLSASINKLQEVDALPAPDSLVAS